MLLVARPCLFFRVSQQQLGARVRCEARRAGRVMLQAVCRRCQRYAARPASKGGAHEERERPGAAQEGCRTRVCARMRVAR